MRTRLPRLRWPSGWTALALGCAAALVALALAGEPRIAGVTVQGAHHLSAAAAATASGLSGRPVFSASAAEARLALLRIPAVRDARVRIALPGDATIELSERSAVARWIVAGAEWYADADGVLFRSVDPAGAPALRIRDDRPATAACAGARGGACLDPAQVAGAVRLAHIAPGELRADATAPEVHLDPVQGLVVRSGAGWEVRFGSASDLELKLANAKRVLSDQPTRRLDYVDVRSPDRVVFSPIQ